MSASAGPRTDLYDDEISLYDLWDVIERRIAVLISVSLGTLMLGVGYAVSAPVKYEYRSGVELPQIFSGGEFANVVTQERAIARLEDVLIPQQREQRLGDDEAPVPRVVARARGTDSSLVLMSTGTRDEVGRVAQLHEGVIEALSGWLAPRYEQALAAKLRPLINRAEALDAQIEQLQGDLNILYASLGQGDGFTSLILAQQIGDLLRQLSSLRTTRVDIASSIENTQSLSQDIERTFVAVRSTEPVGKSRALIVALSVVLGGALGLFAVLVWEFVSNARRRRGAAVSKSEDRAHGA